MTISTLILAVVLGSSQLVSIDTKEMELSDFLRLMANTANVNVVLHPALQGKVKLRIQDALWDQVLDAVLKNHGLAKEIEGNIIRIAPSAVFEAERKQAAATEAARLNALPLQTQIYFLNYAKAEDVVSVVSKLLSPRGS